MTRRPAARSFGRSVSRRDILRAMVGAGAAAALAACRGNGSRRASPTAAAPTPSSSAPVAVTSVAGYDNPQVWQGRTLVVSSWGGEYQDAQQQAMFDPFERLTGAKIVTRRTDTDALRKQVENKETEWDLSDVLSDDVLPLANLGVLEELDYNIIDAGGLFNDLTMEYGVGSSYYATIMAYNTDMWPAASGPKTWADYWDTARFPGARGLHRDPQTTLEFALLADGVAPDQLYPLDIDRAFQSLDRILPEITLWWEQGAQPAQTLTGGGLTLSSAWHNRILTIQAEDAPVAIVWAAGALSGDSWVVPKGAPNREVAMDFINFATRPEVSAAFSSIVPFGPVNKSAFDFLPPAANAYLPTSPTLKPELFTIDFEWWFKRRDVVVDRFEEWLTEHP